MSGHSTFGNVKIDGFFSLGNCEHANTIWVLDDIKKLLLKFLDVIMYHIMVLHLGKIKILT